MIRIFIAICVIILCQSCVKDTQDQTRLNEFERKQVDSLYFVIKPRFEQELDSLCKIKIEQMYPTLIDSITTQRLNEIEKIMKQ